MAAAAGGGRGGCALLTRRTSPGEPRAARRLGLDRGARAGDRRDPRRRVRRRPADRARRRPPLRHARRAALGDGDQLGPHPRHDAARRRCAAWCGSTSPRSSPSPAASSPATRGRRARPRDARRGVARAMRRSRWRARSRQRSPDAIRAGKQLLERRASPPASKTACGSKSSSSARLIGSPNQLEAVQANMERRPPRFTDPS